MAEAYECDRCGGLNGGTPHTALTVESGISRARHRRREAGPDEFVEDSMPPAPVDLCAACLDHLRRWWVEGGGDSERIEIDRGGSDE